MLVAGETLIFFGFVAFASGIVVLTLAFQSRRENTKASSYDEEWREENKYCQVCGRTCKWNLDSTPCFDRTTGLPYSSEVWGCPTAGHTYYGLISAARRKDYEDATEP